MAEEGMVEPIEVFDFKTEYYPVKWRRAMTEERKFPIEGADSCPNCGSKERIFEQIIHDLKEAGKLSKDAFPKGVILQVQMFEPKKTMMLTSPIIKIPIVQVSYDICAECKTMYCTGVTMIEIAGKVQVTSGQPPPRVDLRGGRPGP